jgi:hypothetical protein
MKKNLAAYYLIPFTGSFIAFFLKIITSNSVRSLQENIFLSLFFALIASLIIGTIYYLYDTKWGPQKRTKSLSKSPFKELKEYGFQEYEDFITGFVNNYTVFVSYVWFTGKPAINIEVLFHPKSSGQFLTLQELKQLRKRNRITNFIKDKEYSWQRNAVGYLMEYNLKPPTYEKVLEKACHITEILIREHLKPITKEETEFVLKELREWMKANKKEESIS